MLRMLISIFPGGSMDGVDSSLRGLPQMVPHSLYCDGGIIGRNPSKLGGTWCFCWVNEDGQRMRHETGIVTPELIGVESITNNFTELLAAVKALQSVPKAWKNGILYTDSLITLRRLKDSPSFNNIPLPLKEATLYLRKYLKFKVKLVKGHPNLAHLEEGKDHKGRLVSRHNVYCDEKCQETAEKYLQGRLKVPERMDYGKRLKLPARATLGLSKEA
jgi:ribonuclease HI